MRGRIAQAQWKVRGLKEIDVFSVYLHTESNKDAENQAILAELSRRIAEENRPYIIGGDFDKDYEELAASKWLEAVSGILVA
eukprot:5929139-Karenia_brevis.AAC.1